MNGYAYFKIWPGDKDVWGTYQPTLEGDVYQANALADRFLREVQIVFGLDNVFIHPTIPNLIVAQKTDTVPSTENTIMIAQQLSALDAQRFQQVAQRQAVAAQARLVSSSIGLFKTAKNVVSLHDDRTLPKEASPEGPIGDDSFGHSPKTSFHNGQFRLAAT